MIEKVMPGIYRIEVPLPDETLKTVNSYLLKGKERDLLVDTGMNKKECWEALLFALRELGTGPETIDIFITHLHHDHFGLAMPLASKETTIYLNAQDAEFLKDLRVPGKDLVYARLNGFPVDEVQKAMWQRDEFIKTNSLEELKKALPGSAGDDVPKSRRFHFLCDGDILNIGEYSFECLMTPGHSSGHLCLYEARHKILFSGDHILEDITPAVFLWPGDKRNPLKEYLNSLDRVLELEVAAVLPGHRKVFQDYRERISELKEHHYYRKEEMASFLDTNGKNAYQIASKASWNIPLPWEQFPPHLKWMALAETLAHLKYMEEREQVKSELRDGVMVYYRS